MTEENFEAVIDEQLKCCKNLLIRKGKEYDQETEDRLRSFKVAAELEGITQKQALAGMMSKHTVSIYDLIRNDEHNATLWTEKNHRPYRLSLAS